MINTDIPSRSSTLTLMGEGKIKRLELTYTHTAVHKIGNEDLLYSTGKYTRYCIITYIEKESEKEWIYVYV